MTNKEFISLSELKRLTDYWLKLRSNLNRMCGGVPKEGTAARTNLQRAAQIAEEMKGSVRKIKIASLMFERTLVSVSGVQGAGKTTLMKYFYDLDDEYLNISLDRGEEIPIYITEKSGLDKPQLYAFQIVKDEKGDYYQKDVALTPEEFRTASKGGDTDTLYLELYVPERYTHNDKISFVLLPGFEKQQSSREELVDFAISSSNATIFAFDGNRLSQGENYEHLKALADKFGAYIIYAITRSDIDPDGNAGVKKNFIDKMEITEEDRVVCTGAYDAPDQNRKWCEELFRAVDKYGCTKLRSQENNLNYLADEIDNLRYGLYEIDTILDDEDESDMVSHESDRLIQYFDDALDQAAEVYQKKLDKAYSEGCRRSEGRLSEEFNKRYGNIRSIRRMITGTTRKDIEDAPKIVEQSMYRYEEPEHENALTEYSVKRYSLPDECAMNALTSLLKELEDPEKTPMTSAFALTDGGALMDNEDNHNARDAVCALVLPRGAGYYLPKNTNGFSLMKSIVGMATYYYGISCHDQLADNLGVEEYELSNDKISVDAVREMAKKAFDITLETAAAAAEVKNWGNDDEKDQEVKATAEKLYNKFKESPTVVKWAGGLLGVTGMDLAGDATINMIPQIAASFGISMSAVAGAAVGAIGFGSAVAVMRDITRIQCQDYERARIALNNAYDAMEQRALDDYKEKMRKLRSQIVENMNKGDRRNWKTVQLYNAKKIVGEAEMLLEDLADLCRDKAEERFL